MNRMSPFILLFILICLLATSGCAPYTENNIVEEIAPVIFWSIKSNPNGELSISTLVPALVEEKKQVYTAKINLLKEGGEKFNIKYYRELKAGQLRMVFINKNVAKKGIKTLINTLFTDPDISPRLFIVIVDGDFETYLQNTLEKEQNLDYFLYRMLKHYQKYNQGEMSIVNLHEFMKQLYSPLQDPILPVFKANANEFSYKGTALFRGDKLETTIDGMNNDIFQLLGNDHYLKILVFSKQKVVLGRVRSRVNFSLKPTSGVLNVTAKISGRIEEYQGNQKILDQEGLAALNKNLEAFLENQTTAILKMMQKEKVDPLQIGMLTRSPFHQPMTDQEWKKQWENLKFNVKYSIRDQPLTTGNFK
jgi:spore germination protein